VVAGEQLQDVPARLPGRTVLDQDHQGAGGSEHFLGNSKIDICKKLCQGNLPQAMASKNDQKSYQIM